MATHVWLKNPATGGVWECPNDEAVLAFYTARGWEPTEAPSEDEEAPAPVAETPAAVRARKPRKPRSTN